MDEPLEPSIDFFVHLLTSLHSTEDVTIFIHLALSDS